MTSSQKISKIKAMTTVGLYLENHLIWYITEGIFISSIARHSYFEGIFFQYI